MNFSSSAWQKPRIACWSVALAVPILFVACGSDSAHSPATIADGGASFSGAAGKDSGQAGSSGADIGAAGMAGEAGTLGEDAGSAGASPELGGQGGVSGGGSTQPPSCRAGSTLKCGPNEESCCTSLPLPGQTFYRSYDAISADYKSQAYPASVTGFRLDKFEVTVGRFRQFVAAVVGSWRPSAGDGKHTHLNGGKGLVNVGTEGGNEAGWDAAWSDNLASKAADWDAGLACDQAAASWTPKAGSKELFPISCVNWYEAYAFCIWDEGFLPSDAEWNDAASAGAQQRVYPWSSPPTSDNIDCMHANYRGTPSADGPDYCVAPGTGSVAQVGSQSPLGDGRWGQSDLAGNVYEWTLDSFAKYSNTCPDCVNSDALETKVIRGGGYTNAAVDQLVSARAENAPVSRSVSMGFRCARLP